MINTRFWLDDYTSNLDPIEKLLFLYFLTNTSTEICGVYEIPLKIVAVETGIDKEMVEKILGRFKKDKKIFYVDGWVYINNFTKHQAKNPSVELGIKRCFEEVPDSVVQAVNSLLQGRGNLTKLNLTKPNLTKRDFSSKTNKINFTSKDVELADLMVSLIQKSSPDWQMRGDRDKWAEDINKIHRLDNRTYEQIEGMIRWVRQDKFWSQNILSASKLREKFNDLIPKITSSKKEIIGLDKLKGLYENK